MTQESFRESSMKELGRLEGQLAGLRQELAALTLKQDSVANQVGLLPQQLQAVRDDVSWDHPDLLLHTLSSGTICPRAESLLPWQPFSPTSPPPCTWHRCWLPLTGALPVLLSITWRVVHSVPHVAQAGACWPCPRRPVLLPYPFTLPDYCPVLAGALL